MHGLSQHFLSSGGGGGDGCSHKLEVETFTATAGQALFTLSNLPSGDIIFARNGATLNDGEATVSGLSVTYSGITLVAGDRVDISYVWADCSEPANPLNLDWHITGNAGTDDAVHFAGTVDDQDYSIRTNNIERMRVLASNGFIGQGTATPTAHLHTVGTAPNVSYQITNLSAAAGHYASLSVTSGPVNLGFGTTGASGFGYIGTATPHDFRVFVGNVYAMRIANSTKHVAIGNFIPLSRLDVNGSFGTQVTTSPIAVTMSDIHRTLVIDVAGVVQPLPAVAFRREYIIKNASPGNITVTGHIDGNPSGIISIASGQSLMFQAGLTTWYTLCCANNSLPLTYELKLSGLPPGGEVVNQNTVISAVSGSITMVNNTSQPKRFYETASLVEVALQNISFAGAPRLGARLQRSLDGGVTWLNHSSGGANPWIAVPNGQQIETSGGQGSYFHTVAANSSLTVSYRALRVIDAAGLGQAVSVNFAALEAMIMEIR